jgi:N-acylneuraminate cytidylyltransferase
MAKGPGHLRPDEQVERKDGQMIFNQRVVAIVPIKAHSERVPEKNVRSFAGRPLFHHILTTLGETYAIDEILVDTDSDRIAAEAAEFEKVTIAMRPTELQGDMVSVNRIIAHDLTQTDAQVYLQTHATNPLLREPTVSQAIAAFAKSEQHDSLFTVNRLQTRLYFEDGRPINHDPSELLRTQDLPPVYEENSCLYVFTPESFRAAGQKRIGNRPMMYEIDRIEAIDIDDEFTFGLAEMLARYARETRRLR